MRQIVGELSWLSICTRPDISYAVNTQALYQEHPTQVHASATKSVIRYLKGSQNLGLTFHRNDTRPMYAACDANFSNEPKKCSRSGFAVFRAGAATVWGSNTNKPPAQSTAEAELVSGSECTKSVLWVRQLLEEIGWAVEGPTMIHIDNQSTIRLATMQTSSHRMRHVAVRDQLISHHVEEGNITVTYIPTADNPSDHLTKPLRGEVFLKHRRTLMGEAGAAVIPAQPASQPSS